MPKQPVTLTEQQQQAIIDLPAKGWHPNMDEMHHLIGEKAVAVLCTAKLGSTIWLVIETDGHTHS